MLSRKAKTNLAITVMVVAVILIVIGLHDIIFPKKQATQDMGANLSTVTSTVAWRNIFSGQPVNEDWSSFPVAIMLDNAYNIRPQAGLGQADIIYEALAESNITRLLAIFDSHVEVEKIGPVRSARPYFMDWAEEYGGLYMHVGGSPQALAKIKDYQFINIDQIGMGETYFWRDQKLSAPANVFTSSANWRRAGEMKEVKKLTASSSLVWNFVEPDKNDQTDQLDLTINYSVDYYKVEWRYNPLLQAYQRWQNNAKFDYDTGEQALAQNVIIQVAPANLIDIERRSIDTKKGGQAIVFNVFGKQTGQWKYIDGRTRFLADDGSLIKFAPGKTWVQVVDSLDKVIIQ
ncbi:MAG: DUF3048 domain-containing protein [Patescibacteria group bacterium]